MTPLIFCVSLRLVNATFRSELAILVIFLALYDNTVYMIMLFLATSHIYHLH